jgi:hypothetical protein
MLMRKAGATKVHAETVAATGRQMHAREGNKGEGKSLHRRKYGIICS